MEIHPPIKDRTDKQLFEIIETKEEWREEVVKLAQDELIKRGIPIPIQEKRRKSFLNYNARIKSIKAKAEYSNLEKLMIVVLGPILVVILRDFFLFDSGEGYVKKNRQAWVCLFLGVLLYGLGILILNNLKG